MSYDKMSTKEMIRNDVEKGTQIDGNM